MNSEAHLLKAKIYTNLRQFSSSLNSYKKVLKLLPNNIEAIYGEGKCFKELGFFYEAIAKFQQTIPNAKAFNSIGTCHYCMGNKEEAIHQYNKAIQLNPNYTEAYFNKGICLSNLNKKEDAILMYNKAIELNNNYVDAYFQRGYCLFSLDRFEEAMNEMNKVIELDNNYPQAYFERGSCLIKTQSAMIHINFFISIYIWKVFIIS